LGLSAGETRNRILPLRQRCGYAPNLILKWDRGQRFPLELDVLHKTGSSAAEAGQHRRSTTAKKPAAGNRKFTEKRITQEVTLPKRKTRVTPRAKATAPKRTYAARNLDANRQDLRT